MSDKNKVFHNQNVCVTNARAVTLMSSIFTILAVHVRIICTPRRFQRNSLVLHQTYCTTRKHTSSNSNVPYTAPSIVGVYFIEIVFLLFTERLISVKFFINTFNHKHNFMESRKFTPKFSELLYVSNQIGFNFFNLLNTGCGRITSQILNANN